MLDLEKFEEKYKDKGGIRMLARLSSLLFTREYIANHFGVSKPRVGQWMKDGFGYDYDPRPDRRKVIMDNMVEFARHNPKDRFDFAFGKNGGKNMQLLDYYKEALERCHKEKIYGKEQD